MRGSVYPVDNELPDGNIFTIGAKRLRRGGDVPNDTSVQNIVKCDVDTRKEFYVRIVSSGGTASATTLLSRTP